MNLHEYEFNHELLNEYEGEYESHEYELATQLMSVNNELEFENFLGSLLQGASKLYNSPQGQAIKRSFISGAKQFGKKMIPSIGKNLGSYVGGAKGGKFGGQVGSALSGLLFDNESDAIDYVRIIRNAANYLNKALDNGTNLPPKEAVTQAINTAARPYRNRRGTRALRQTPPSNRVQSAGSGQQSGRWVRRGNAIQLLNAA